MHTLSNGVKIEGILEDWEIPLAEYVARLVADEATGHDIYHCLRVRRNALRIAAGEELDIEILAATAYLHDIGREPEREGQGNHVDIGVEVAQRLLCEIHFPKAKRQAVIACIEYHEDYPWCCQKRASLPAKNQREILGFQDADRLDAIGAIGIARMFAFGGAHRRTLWIPEIDPEYWEPGNLNSSTYNHLREKLLKLKDAMNTATGRKMAQCRHQFMEAFMREFEQEWFGED